MMERAIISFIMYTAGLVQLRGMGMGEGRRRKGEREGGRESGGMKGRGEGEGRRGRGQEREGQW